MWQFPKKQDIHLQRLAHRPAADADKRPPRSGLYVGDFVPHRYEVIGFSACDLDGAGQWVDGSGLPGVPFTITHSFPEVDLMKAPTIRRLMGRTCIVALVLATTPGEIGRAS